MRRDAGASASVRAQAATLERTLHGWSCLVRDMIFYGGVYGREAEISRWLAERLRASVGEVCHRQSTASQ